MRKEKIIVILGQTATGKSDLAVKIAKKIGGEIISADSRQVYRSLDLGTGKITKEEMRGIPHHLLDVVNPKKQFSAAQYQQKAISAIAEIVKRGKVPIICGGSGFHIDAITKNIVFPEVPPNKKLRDRLSQKSTILLFRELKRLNPARAKNIEEKNEQNNRVRLIRAIEIARKIGQVPKLENDTLSAGAESVSSKYKFVKIGLYLPRQILKKKIEKRLLKRIRLGMIQEAKNLHQKNLTWKRMKELGLEYRYLALYLQGKINKSEMIEKLKTEIYHYAKRQMTWFKRDKEIIWLDASKKLNLGKILAYSL